MTKLNSFGAIARCPSFLFLLGLASMLFGCAREVLPTSVAGRSCVSRAKTTLAQCKLEAQRSQAQCVQQERQAAQGPYQQALAQYERDGERANREYQRERQRQRDAYRAWQSQFERCKQQQRRAARTDRTLDLDWAIAYYCDDTPPSGFDAGPEFIRRPDLDDFVNTDHCDRQFQYEENSCSDIYKAQFTDCGGTFE